MTPRPTGPTVLAVNDEQHIRALIRMGLSMQGLP